MTASQSQVHESLKQAHKAFKRLTSSSLYPAGQFPLYRFEMQTKSRQTMQRKPPPLAPSGKFPTANVSGSFSSVLIWK